jgi:hypothetical protein
LLGAVSQGFVKRTAFSQSNITQCFAQYVFVKFFGSNEINLRNVGTLFNDQHQHIATDFNPNIFKKTQSEQTANCGCAFIVVVVVPNTQSDGGKDSTRLDPLQALYANITYFERVGSPCMKSKN